MGKVSLFKSPSVKFNIGTHSVFYEKFKSIIDKLPAEIWEMIKSDLSIEDLTIISGDKTDEEVEGPNYVLPEYESEYETEYELYGDLEIEESETDDDMSLGFQDYFETSFQGDSSL